MKFSRKQRIKILLNYCIGWTIAFAFLAIVRGVGTTENGALKFDFLSSMLLTFTIAPIVGFISGYSQLLTEERAYKRVSIQKLLTLRLIYVILFFIALIIISYAAYQFYFGTTLDIISFAFDSGSFAIYFYVLVVDLFMIMLRQVNLLLGENKLMLLLMGKFYTPREEERVFMFLDLQSSTQLAEKLGHIRYSKLIQDCFNDLGVVAENEAEIYQYVGDEVVLTWKLQEGLRKQNCLKAYYNFKQQLAQKQNYYEETYGALPFFKAGMNEGLVTVTEVGKYKKEIAYHGDAINTAARIQGKCNEFNQELLISENLKTKLALTGYSFNKLGSVELRGKNKEVGIYAVTLNNK